MDGIRIFAGPMQRGEWSIGTYTEPFAQFVIFDAPAHLEYPTPPRPFIVRSGWDREKMIHDEGARLGWRATIQPRNSNNETQRPVFIL